METNNNSVLIVSSDVSFVCVEISQDRLDTFFSSIHDLDLHQKSLLARQVSTWMDSCPEYPMVGGFGHRILHGHSISDLATVHQKFGMNGVKEWIIHNNLDMTSKDGLPIPFAKEIYNLIPGINIHDAIKWLCFNITDLLATSLAVTSLFMHYKENRLPSVLAQGGLIKTIAGALTGNPVLIALGAFTLATSIIGFVQGEEVLDRYLLLDNFSNLSTKINALNINLPICDYENFKNI